MSGRLFHLNKDQGAAHTRLAEIQKYYNTTYFRRTDQPKCLGRCLLRVSQKQTADPDQWVRAPVVAVCRLAHSSAIWLLTSQTRSWWPRWRWPSSWWWGGWPRRRWLWWWWASQALPSGCWSHKLTNGAAKSSASMFLLISSTYDLQSVFANLIKTFLWSWPMDKDWCGIFHTFTFTLVKRCGMETKAH